MDSETRQMFSLILDKLDKVDNKLDNIETRVGNVETRLENVEIRLENVETRLGSVETEIKDFRQEVKQDIKGLDGKMNIIYNKLSTDISNLSSTPKSKYTVIKED